MTDLQARAEAAADHDAWVLAQLKAWPTRIHPERTINIEYLMQEAAKRIDALQSDGWQPIETAPYGEQVEVRVGSMAFLAELHPGVSEDEAGNACDQWAAVIEGEHPPCWTDGGCWASNADEMQSLQPTAWRPAPPDGESV